MISINLNQSSCLTFSIIHALNTNKKTYQRPQRIAPNISVPNIKTIFSLQLERASFSIPAQVLRHLTCQWITEFHPPCAPLHPLMPVLLWRTEVTDRLLDTVAGASAGIRLYDRFVNGAVSRNKHKLRAPGTALLLLLRPPSSATRSPSPSLPLSRNPILPPSTNPPRNPFPPALLHRPFFVRCPALSGVDPVCAHVTTAIPGEDGRRPPHNGVNQEILASPCRPPPRRCCCCCCSFNTALYTLVFSSRRKNRHSLHDEAIVEPSDLSFRAPSARRRLQRALRNESEYVESSQVSRLHRLILYRD